MPRFFFHSEDGQVEYDQQGTPLADAEAARLQGMQLAGALLKDRSEALSEGSSWRLVVTDERHAVVFTLAVNVSNADSAWKHMLLVSNPTQANGQSHSI